MQSWHHAWQTALKHAGLKYRWNDLRHTFITRLAENPEISEQTLMDLAGHVSKEMLERYSHTGVKAKQDAIAEMNAIAELERARVTQNPRGGVYKNGCSFDDCGFASD